MEFSHFTSKLPLKKDSERVIRVIETRVTLDVVIGAFKNGATCEEIVLQYPVLNMGDVYLIIGFYLKNREVVEQYLEIQNAESAPVRQKIEAKFPTSRIRKHLLDRHSVLQSAAS